MARLRIAGVLSFTLALSAYAGQGSYLLRVKPVKGQKAIYVMNMDMSMDMSKMPQNAQTKNMPKTMKMNVAMNYTMQHKSSAGDKHVFLMTINSANMKSNMPNAGTGGMEKLKGQTSTLTMNSRGKVLKIEGKAFQGMTQMGGSGFSNVMFPEKPVRIGQSWSEKVDAQGMSMNVNYKLVGTSNVNGKTALVIDSTVTGNSMISTPRPLKIYVNPVNGELLKMNGMMKTAMMDGVITMSITRK